MCNELIESIISIYYDNFNTFINYIISQIEENSPLVLDRVQNHCLNNFALPVGRGILTYSTTTPIVTEPFSIPEASLTIKVLPFNSTIQVDRTLRIPDNIEWPEFHEPPSTASGRADILLLPSRSFPGARGHPPYPLCLPVPGRGASSHDSVALSVAGRPGEKPDLLPYRVLSLSKVPPPALDA